MSLTNSKNSGYYSRLFGLIWELLLYRLLLIVNKKIILTSIIHYLLNTIQKWGESIVRSFLNRGGICHEKLRSREGFHFADSWSEYAPLIGWHVRLIKVLVYDWLKRRPNKERWLVDINYTFCFFLFIYCAKYNFYIFVYFQHFFCLVNQFRRASFSRSKLLAMTEIWSLVGFGFFKNCFFKICSVSSTWFQLKTLFKSNL